MSVGVSLDEVLARHHVGLTGEEFVAQLDVELSKVAHSAAVPLSAVEREFLQEHGGPSAAEALAEDPDATAQAASQAAAHQVTELVQGSLSIAEAALLLRVDRSRVSQRLSHGSLWGFGLGRSRRLPRWQFTADGDLLPGLEIVIDAIPAGLAPFAVAGFMSTPQPELGDAAPVAYLASGGDPRLVADSLAGLGLW
jgi:hypothetical protein